MSRAAARVRVHVRSPLQHYKKGASFFRADEESELSHKINDLSLNWYLPESECGNRVMVVIESNHEAKGALEWALSHTVQSQDTIILLHVARKGTFTYVSFFEVMSTIMLLLHTSYQRECFMFQMEKVMWKLIKGHMIFFKPQKICVN